MKLKMLVISLMLLIAFPVPGMAEDGQTTLIKELNQIADDALQMTKQQRYADAKQLLEHFSGKFVKVNHADNGTAMRDLRVITATHEEALGSVTAASLPHRERVMKVTQFRLAVDALYSDHHPLWEEMQETVLDTWKMLNQSAKANDDQKYQQVLNQFLEKYSMIQPSIMLDRPETQVQMLDSRIAFLENNRSDPSEKKARVANIEELQRELIALFEGQQRDDADPSLIWVMIMVGSAISVTLIYAGWQKYKGEKQKEKQKRRQHLND